MSKIELESESEVEGVRQNVSAAHQPLHWIHLRKPTIKMSALKTRKSVQRSLVGERISSGRLLSPSKMICLDVSAAPIGSRITTESSLNQTTLVFGPHNATDSIGGFSFTDSPEYNDLTVCEYHFS